MSGRYIELADGTEYQNGECGYADGTLVCWLPSDTEMVSAFSAFSNPEKTSHIAFHYGDMQTEYDDFTDLRGIHRDYDEQIVIQLRKGET